MLSLIRYIIQEEMQQHVFDLLIYMLPWIIVKHLCELAWHPSIFWLNGYVFLMIKISEEWSVHLDMIDGVAEWWNKQYLFTWRLNYSTITQISFFTNSSTGFIYRTWNWLLLCVLMAYPCLYIMLKAWLGCFKVLRVLEIFNIVTDQQYFCKNT